MKPLINDLILLVFMIFSKFGIITPDWGHGLWANFSEDNFFVLKHAHGGEVTYEKLTFLLSMLFGRSWYIKSLVRHCLWFTCLIATHNGIGTSWADGYFCFFFLQRCCIHPLHFFQFSLRLLKHLIWLKEKELAVNM